MEMVLPIYDDLKHFKGFAGIIYSMVKGLNLNEEFKQKFSEDNYSLFLAVRDDSNAIKIQVNDGKLSFTPYKNSQHNMKEIAKECDGIIRTTRSTFLGLGLGKVNPLKVILTGKLRIKGMKYVKQFTSYFSLL